MRQDAEIGVALVEHADARRVRRAELVDEPASDGFLAVEHAADILRQLAGAHHILGESLRRDMGMTGDEPDDPIADARNVIVRLRHADHNAREPHRMDRHGGARRGYPLFPPLRRAAA